MKAPASKKKEAQTLDCCSLVPSPASEKRSTNIGLLLSGTHGQAVDKTV